MVFPRCPPTLGRLFHRHGSRVHSDLCRWQQNRMTKRSGPQMSLGQNGCADVIYLIHIAEAINIHNGTLEN